MTVPLVDKQRVPALTPPRPAAKLSYKSRTGATGLTTTVVRKPGVPLAELRLRIPFLGGGSSHPARALVLSDALLTGAGAHDRASLAIAIQELGADLAVSVDADRLLVSGNVVASALPRLLTLLATLLTEPTYARDEVVAERTRIAERLRIARSRAGTIAAERLARRMWGEHPYAIDLPEVGDVASVTPAQVRALHRDRVRPAGANLVIVGDVSPSRALDQVDAALASWTGAARTPRVPALPTPSAGPLLVVDRPGSVQSSLRMGAPAISRSDSGYPALQLANIVFGGYFSSRWTANLREDKGYTYGPHSRIEHSVLGSTLLLDVEVASEVTAPALLETGYELGRIAALPVTDGEVDAARQYAIGTLALSVATQAGLASTLSALTAFGLAPEWIAAHTARLAETTLEQVSASATEFFAPARMVSVVVGDADSIAGPLAALGPIET